MRKRLLVIGYWFIAISFFIQLTFASVVFADRTNGSDVGPTTEPQQSQSATNPALQGVFGSVNAPSQLQSLFGSTTPEEGISNVLSLVIQLIYVIASIIFIFYLLYSGLQFIYSEGSKEAVAEARGRITWAIVGIIFMALVFVLLKILSIVTGFTFFS